MFFTIILMTNLCLFLFGLCWYLYSPFPFSFPVVLERPVLSAFGEFGDQHGRNQVFPIHLIWRTHAPDRLTDFPTVHN